MKYASLFLTLVFFHVLPAAASTNRACIIAGTITITSKPIEVMDCLQNDGEGDALFKKTCSDIAMAGAAFSAKPPKLTYAPACPAQHQGACSTFFGKPMSSYYYKRSAADIQETRKSCEAMGAKWIPAPR